MPRARADTWSRGYARWREHRSHGRALRFAFLATEANAIVGPPDRFGIRVLSSTLDTAQLGRLVETAPSGVQWLHEIKLDGFHMSGALTAVGRKR